MDLREYIGQVKKKKGGSMSDVDLLKNTPRRSTAWADPSFQGIAPLENYKPSPLEREAEIGQAEMMDISRRDSPNFGNWMREAGGFHFDEDQKKFVSDRASSGILKTIGDVVNRHGDVADDVLSRFRDRMMAAPGATAKGLIGLPEAVSSSYPRFKDEVAQAPKQALMDMAARSEENPAGYMTDAMTGGMGAPGALATLIGAGSDAVQGIRLGTVGGSLAKGFSEAKQMGKTWMGIEGVPKFEINDEAAKLKDLSKLDWNTFSEHGAATGKLGDILEHPELYKNYPELSGMTIEVNPNINSIGQFHPKSDLMDEMIQIRGGRNNLEALNRVKGNWEAWAKSDFEEGLFPSLKDARKWHKAELEKDILGGGFTDADKSTLLHEIQHAIQQRENFGRGGNVAEFSNNPSRIAALKEIDGLKQKLQNIDDPDAFDAMEDRLNSLRSYLQDTEPFEQYRRLGGEAEARNVQGRMNMTEAERGLKPFTETYDVPLEQQIIRRRSAPASLQDFMSEMERLKS